MLGKILNLVNALFAVVLMVIASVYLFRDMPAKADHYAILAIFSWVVATGKLS